MVVNLQKVVTNHGFDPGWRLIKFVKLNTNWVQNMNPIVFTGPRFTVKMKCFTGLTPETTVVYIFETGPPV